MKFEIRALTFGGFYGGLWDQGENEYNEAQLDEALDIVQLTDEWGFGPNYRNEVAEIYAQDYVDMCNEILDVDLKRVSQRISSPREYNFETDKIFIEVEIDDYTKFIDKLIKFSDNPEYRAKLGNMIRERHTSCSGLWSWMSNDIEKWFMFMYDPDNSHYTSFFMAYLMEVIDPLTYEDLDYQVYSYVSESTGLHVVLPETPEAREEYELFQQYPEAYAAFVEGDGAGYFNGYCPKTEAWEEYKTLFHNFLEEYKTQPHENRNS